MHWLRVFVSIVLGGFGLLAVSASAQATGDLPIEIVPPTQHTQGVNSVVFSNGDDDRFIASSGEDGVIKLWDVRTGRLIRNVVRIDLNNKYWRVKSLSSDGRLLFGVVADQYKVWSTLTGKELASIATGGGDHDEDIIYISHDGSRLATPRADKTIKLFDAQNGKEVATLKNALDLAFSADGKRAVVATYDKKIELWDAVTGTRIDTLATSDEMLKRVSYTPSGRRIASKSTSGLIKLWDAGNKRQITEVPGNEQSKSLFSPDGAYWAVQDGMGTVKILNSETGATYSSFKAPEKTSILQFSLDNRILIFEPDASAGGQAPEWTFLSVNSSTGEVVGSGKGAPENDIYLGTRFYVENDKGTLRLRDLGSGEEARTFTGQLPLSASVFSAAGSRIALAVSGKPIVLDADTGQRSAACPAYSGEINGLALSADAQQLLYGGEEKSIVLCDVQSGAAIRSFIGHDAPVKAVAFSGDAHQVLSGDENGTVKLWELSTGKLLRTFKGNERSAFVVAFTPEPASPVES